MFEFCPCFSLSLPLFLFLLISNMCLCVCVCLTCFNWMCDEDAFAILSGERRARNLSDSRLLFSSICVANLFLFTQWNQLFFLSSLPRLLFHSVFLFFFLFLLFLHVQCIWWLVLSCVKYCYARWTRSETCSLFFLSLRSSYASSAKLCTLMRRETSARRWSGQPLSAFG